MIHTKLIGIHAIVLGVLIEQIREQRGWGQVELAKRVGIMQSAISKYESGEIGIGAHRVHLFAKLLGQTPEELLGVVDVVVAQLHKRLARDLGKLPATGWEEPTIARLGRGPLRGYARYLVGLTLADSAAVR